VRLSVVVFGFYSIVLMSDWQGFLACATGFLGARLALRSRVPEAKHA
jgi:hypothetical protein